MEVEVGKRLLGFRKKEIEEEEEEKRERIDRSTYDPNESKKQKEDEKLKEEKKTRKKGREKRNGFFSEREIRQ